jgi:hypothetical protein
MRTTIVLAALVLGGCAPEERTVESFKDVCATMRVISDSPDRALAATVEFSTCAKKCDTVEEAMCEIEEADGVVSVEGLTRVARDGNDCSGSCEPIFATCEAILELGDYRIEAGDIEWDISHPIIGTDCASGPPPDEEE